MKNKKKIRKKFLATHPKYSQMELRAMQRGKRIVRPKTPMSERKKRQQDFWDFAKKERKKKPKKTFKKN